MLIGAKIKESVNLKKDVKFLYNINPIILTKFLIDVVGSPFIDDNVKSYAKEILAISKKEAIR